VPDEAMSSALVDVRHALAALRTARSLQDLYERATRALCEHCGFDRAVVFRLQGYEMIPQSVYFARDAAWAQEFQAIGQATPMRIDYDIVETDMISTREPMLVPEAQSNPRGFKPLVEAARTRSYVAAPLVPENVIIGFVHADCYFRDRDVDSRDRDVIGAFGEGLGYAIERTSLLRQVQSQRTQIGLLRAVVDEMVEKVSDAVAGVERAAGSADRPSAPVLTVPAFEITRREAGILQLLQAGVSDAEIAARLAIPKASVEWHIERAIAKLGAASRDEAVSRYRALAVSPERAAVG
jgi:LuxR family transcriptional regulator, regulator of acetate metabolism